MEVGKECNANLLNWRMQLPHTGNRREAEPRFRIRSCIASRDVTCLQLPRVHEELVVTVSQFIHSGEVGATLKK